MLCVGAAECEIVCGFHVLACAHLAACDSAVAVRNSKTLVLGARWFHSVFLKFLVRRDANGYLWMPSSFEQIASLLVCAFGLSGGGTADRAQQVLLILTAFRPHERGFAEFLDTLKEVYADEPRKRLTRAWFLCSGSYWPSRFAPRVFPKQCHRRQKQFSGVASRFYKTYMVRRTSNGIVQNM